MQDRYLTFPKDSRIIRTESNTEQRKRVTCMKQRKLPALLAAAALLAAFTACGGARETVPASSVPQAGYTAEGAASAPTDAAKTPESGAPRLTEAEASGEQGTAPTTEREVEKVLQMKIDGAAVRVDWENNRSVEALKALCERGPLVIPTSMYGGFEQVGPIGSRLPADEAQTTTAAGDIVLYASSQLVVFYGSNSWAYTRLGHITDRDAAGMAALLGKEKLTITISLEEVK